MIQQIPEVPFVVPDKVEELKKTKEAVILLKRYRAWTDVLKVCFRFMVAFCVFTIFYIGIINMGNGKFNVFEKFISL